MKKLLLLPLMLIFFAACEEDDPILLTNRYIKAADVFTLPAINYDPDGSPPDIRIDLKRRSASFWEFSTYTEVNAGSLPTITIFPAEILMTDEVYEIRIVDEDLNLPDDEEIFFWTFQGYDEGENGEYTFWNNGKHIMSLQYNEK
ncbi:hypothetical protein [Owenweeksia hongkongensis]|uniref:hypothetical protein n=1 Tax=Owenweeksia hongkongensis TaxID=253245 RepID=UPI003A9017B1